MWSEDRPGAAQPAGRGPAPGRWQRLRRAFRLSALGMGAEILFAGGLIAIGFAISLLSGW